MKLPSTTTDRDFDIAGPSADTSAPQPVLRGRAGGQLLPTPGRLRAVLPLDADVVGLVTETRARIGEILRGYDDRLLVVVGPCSLHDPTAAIDYAMRLQAAARPLCDDLLVVMRAFPEKPRSRLGWPGMVIDPGLTGRGDAGTGLLVARSTLRSLLRQGMPVGMELVDPIVAEYLTDTASWAAIGARTVESPIHRRLAAGLSPLPVGMKNRVDGAIGPAVDAVATAAASHTRITIDHDGRPVQVRDEGNALCHLVLRGGTTGPNYWPTCVVAATRLLDEARRPGPVVIDASHGNSGKDPTVQARVLADIGGYLPRGDYPVAGVMIESFLQEGRQDLTDVPARLIYGQSITDACLGWDTTVRVLTDLARAARTRRQTLRAGRRTDVRRGLPRTDPGEATR